MPRDFGKSCKQAHLNGILPPHLEPVFILVYRIILLTNSSFLYLTYLPAECSSTMNVLQSTTIHGLGSYPGIFTGNYWPLGLTIPIVCKIEFPLSHAPARNFLTLLFITTVRSNYNHHENSKSLKKLWLYKGKWPDKWVHLGGNIGTERGVGCECVVIFLPVCLDSQVVQENQQILFHPGKDHINAIWLICKDIINWAKPSKAVIQYCYVML